MMRLVPVLTLILILSQSGAADDFTVAPYLADVGAEHAVVAFQLDRSLPAAVTVYDGEERIGEFKSAAAIHHFVELTGLKSGRTYRYAVDCGSVRTAKGDSSYQIRTAGKVGDSFTFAVYGDPRPGDTMTQRHHRDVINQVSLCDPAFVAVLGDMVNDGEVEKQWREFFSVESPVLRRSMVAPVIGDNDYAGGAGLQARWFPKLKKGYYAFNWNGVRFYCMNAWDSRGVQPRNEFDADSMQVKWLQQELATRESKEALFRVLFIHDPVCVCRGRSSDLLRRVFAPIFRKYKVDLVFASWHLYERLRLDGVNYVISGGAGAELIWASKNPEFPSQIDARRYHFCRVDVGSGTLSLRAIADDGTVLDRFVVASRSMGDGASRDQLRRRAKRLARIKRIKTGEGRPELEIYLFSYNCAYCRKLLRQLLPRWASKVGVNLRINYYDLSVRGTYNLFIAAGADFGKQDADLPAIFIGRSVLGGRDEINAGILPMFSRFASDPVAFRARAIVPFTEIHDTEGLREQRFNSLTVGLIVGAGLLDGLNPCAFATLIFLVSYLALVGGSKRQILVTGSLFSLGVFAAYLAIGVLLFRITTWLMAVRKLAVAVNVVMLLLLVCLAAFSVIDFIRCLKGRPTEIALQLPEFLKKNIRERIRSFARNQFGIGMAALVLGAVIAGLELGCTGQVYLPIVTMIADPKYRAQAFLYLLLYNAAFIVPLIAVFGATAFGVTSQGLGCFFQKHVAWVKLGMALLFVGMALLAALNIW